MKLIIGTGGSGGYYPFTQKPIDLQPYRPVYLFRGPPPDAGFSYGLFEDETGKKYYADLGLDGFSPLSGKSAKLLEEMTSEQIEKTLGEDLKSDNLQKRECAYCGADYYDNFHLGLKGRDDFWCHRCGSKLSAPEAPVKEKEVEGNMEQPTTPKESSVRKDPSVKTFVENGINLLSKSTQMKELTERLASRYSLPPERVKHDILIALKDAIR